MMARRLRRSVRTPDRDGDDHILPLVNVVFLLLIYFMILGTLPAYDPLGVDPPHSASDSTADEAGETVLHLGRDGRIAVDGREVEATALLEALADHGATEPSPVAIVADGALETARLVAVLRILREAGVDRTRLVMVRERP